ncbi:unnamed protein product [Ambrosiozyma monospora]|uniref:Unnamed protein product n=1 Tax=Ambrosiozyma monospora TaxID=43982 RepID=A0ACB5T6M9_AMBMO|nr:unnamed protein product [Ambrosiozyma monospora]
MIPTWGIPAALGVIQTQILEHQLEKVDTTTVSWIFSIYMTLAMISCVFCGTYYDRNGVKIPMLIGSVMCVVSLFAMGNCTEVYQFILSFGIGFGVGSAIIVPPVMGAIADYFSEKQRSSAMGFAGTGGCIGGVLFPAMLDKSFGSIGFTWSMRCVAFIDLFCLVVCLILVKDRSTREKKPLTSYETLKLYLLKSFDFKSLLTDRRYFFNSLGCLFAETTVTITFSYFSFITVKNGFTEGKSFLFVTALNAVSTPTRYLSGIIADKYFGTYNVTIFSLVMLGITNLVMWMPFKSNEAALWIYCVSYGAFSSGIYTLIPSCCSQIVRVEVFGCRYATMYFITGLCILGLTPASASIIGDGESGSRNDGFIILMSIFSFLGAFFYFVVKYMTVGLTWKKF